MWVRPPDRPGPPGRPLPDLAIRDGQWKFLVARNGKRGELFDVLADPDEKRNIASEQSDLVKRLSEQVIGWDKMIRKSADENKSQNDSGETK